MALYMDGPPPGIFSHLEGYWILLILVDTLAERFRQLRIPVLHSILTQVRFGGIEQRPTRLLMFDSIDLT